MENSLNPNPQTPSRTNGSDQNPTFNVLQIMKIISAEITNEFIGLTLEQAYNLHQTKDIAYLQS
jgi:hypothetical protein